MKVFIIALSILSVAWGATPSFLTSLQINAFGSVNSHGNLECAVQIKAELNYYDQAETYEFFLIQQKSILVAAAGETGIYCALTSDAGHSWTGSCYTLTVTVASPADMSTGPVASQGK